MERNGHDFSQLTSYPKNYVRRMQKK